MKILIFNRINDRSEVALVKGLAERKHNVHYIGEPEDNSIKDFEELGIKTNKLKVRYRFDFKAVKSLKKIINNSYDVVYAPAGRTLSAYLLSGSKKSKIITYRGTLTRISRLSPGDTFAHLNSRVDKIICNSFAVKAKMKEFKIPEEKLEVVYKGHDLNWYQKKPNPDFSKLGIDPSKFIIGSIANFRPMKGGAILVKAFKQIIKKIPAHLLLIGSLNDNKLKKELQDPELKQHVTCLGFRSDALSWLPHLDLSVISSVKKESFSRAIVESMAYKVPVLVTEIGGMTELVHNLETGLIATPNDEDALAERMIFAYNNNGKLSELSQAAFLRLEQDFNLNKYLDGMERVFSEI